MTEGKRVGVLLGVMIATVVAVGGTTVAWLYQAGFEQQRVRLTQTAQTQVRLIEAVARHEAKRHDIDPDGPEAAVLEQLRDAHAHSAAGGEAGELSIARLEADQMVFILDPLRDKEPPRSLPLSGDLAEPMRRALLGQSDNMVALDSRGIMVLAAYEPVVSLGWGVVAKVDLAAIRAPFVHAGILAGITALGTIIVGVVVFSGITRPLLAHLRDSERQLRRAVTDAPFPIIIHAEDGRVVMTSRILHEITGYRPSEIKTMADWTEKAYGERRDAMKADIDMLYAAKGRVPGGEHRIMTARGEMRIWDFSATPLGRAADGKRHVISMAMDVTRRDQAELVSREASKRYQVLFNSGSDATFLMEASGDNPLGAFVAINDAACRVLGYERAELMRMSPMDIEAPEMRTQFPAHIQELKEKGRALWQGVHLTKDGRRIPVEISGNLFELSGMEVVLAVARDVSDRERVSKALADAKEIAEAANRDKDRLLETLSHELRTPLTPVLLMISVLQEEAGLPRRVLDELAKMRSQIELEARLIDTLIAKHGRTPADAALNAASVDAPDRPAQGGSDISPLFVLPAPAQAAGGGEISGETPPPPIPADEADTLRVLVVEDHAATLKVIAVALNAMGHHVRCARSVRDAIELGEKEIFDLLICDIGLPDGTGMDVMRWFGVRQPIQGIAVSGYGTENDVEQTRGAGFTMHLVKPIAVTALRAAVGQVRPAYTTKNPSKNNFLNWPMCCILPSTPRKEISDDGHGMVGSRV